jgi:hypothetical protein
VSIGKTLLGFLFGKDPQIFDDKGRVAHDLPKEKWDAWHKRYMNDPNMNWRNHRGMQAKSKKS